MLINKKTKAKSKRRFVFGAVAFASLASMATMSLVSCNSTNDTAKPNESNKDVKDPVGFSVYAYLNFKVRSSQAGLGIKFVGDTSVKIKKGHQFGAANPPKVVCDGYTLSHWEKQDGTPITRDTVIDDDILTDGALDVYPAVAPIAEGISISGRETIYDGIMFGEDLDSENGHPLISSYDYVAHIEGITSYTGLTWSVLDDDDQNIEITQDTASPEICHVTTKFTDEPVTDTLHAEWGEFEKDFVITILPPFYATGYVHLSPQTENGNGTSNEGQYLWDMGKSYWIVDHGKWMLVDAPQICVEQYYDEQSYVEFIEPILWEKGASQTVSGKAYHIVKDNDSTTFTSGWTDIYPGAAVTSIGSYFMANFDDANPELHAGINYIANVGDGFLLNCASFNKDIRQLFVEDVIAPIRFGNYFMYGCTSFNNGYSAGSYSYTWNLPVGSIYGNNFLGNCSALGASCKLPITIMYIGSNFMNDCLSLRNFTIPYYSESGEETIKLRTIEAYFLAYCPSLSVVNIDTPTIDYFTDIDKPWADHGAFITKESRGTNIPVIWLKTGELVQQISNLYPVSDPDQTVGPFRNVNYQEV